MDIQRLIHEYGCESLTEDQQTALDEYMGRLMMDAQDIKMEMNDEA